MLGPIRIDVCGLFRAIGSAVQYNQLQFKCHIISGLRVWGWSDKRGKGRSASCGRKKEITASEEDEYQSM